MCTHDRYLTGLGKPPRWICQEGHSSSVQAGGMAPCPAPCPRGADFAGSGERRLQASSLALALIQEGVWLSLSCLLRKGAFIFLK